MHPVDNPGQPAEKGRTKKNPGINPGQPAGEGRKKAAPVPPQKTLPERRPPKKKKKKNSADSAGERHRTDRPVLPRNVVGRTGRFCRGTSSDGRTD